MTSLFSLLLMTVLTSNILIILTVILLSNSKLLTSVGYPVLISITGLIVLRLLLPLETPFMITVRLPEFISVAIAYIRRGFINTNNISISAWTIMYLVWIIGSIYHLYKYIRSYRTMIKKVHSCRHLTEEQPYKDLLDEICNARRKKNNFQIVEANVNIPSIFGIRKPHIILPASMPPNIGRHQIKLILSHEMFHHYNRDLVIKMIVNLLAILYWWNPVCKILKHQTDDIMDMRIDHKLTDGDAATTAEYLHCLFTVKVASIETSDTEFDERHMVSVCRDKDFLEKRFEMMTSRKKRNIVVSLLSIIIAGVVFVLSYTFIFEAYYRTSEVEEVSSTTDELSIYAVKNEQGTYDIYLGGILVETVETLEQFPIDTIYNMEGELIHED